MIRLRSNRQLPKWLLAGLLFLLVVQIALGYYRQSVAVPNFQPLHKPLPLEIYKVLSGGSQKLLVSLLTLRLQLHDVQQGRHMNYRHLDYSALKTWLETLYRLNPDSDYAAFLASRVYASVNDPDDIRLMIDYISAAFQKDPKRFWRRMTEATLLAKHQLKDLSLALALAEQIHQLPSSINIPFWARDMKLVLLDELNQLQSAQLLISSLLQSGSITDEDELRFLKARLLKIQQQLLVNQQNSPNFEKKQSQ